ncbi:MAG: hypothetical protein U0263_17545 [Polyangiaceae bacterium]
MKESPNRPRTRRAARVQHDAHAVKDGQVVLALGGSGGTTIGTNVTQLLLGRMAFGKSPAEPGQSPALLHPDSRLQHKPLRSGAAPALIQDLEVARRGRGQHAFHLERRADDRHRERPQAPRLDPRKHGSAKAE